MAQDRTWVRFLWETPWLWLAFIIPLACVPLFIGLDRTDLDNDEAIYSFAVETMLRDGDWLTPKIIPSETSAFLEKPPLKFWITAAPIRLGLLPSNEFGLRFMDAAMSALAFLYVFAIGRRLAGPVCGLTAVLLLMTHEPLLYHHGLRSNNMESTTVLGYAAAVYHFMAWRSVNPDMKRHVYAMSLWFVFAFMTKFVAALFLPVILGLAALLRHEDRVRLYRDWRTFALAALLAVAFIAPWFVYQYIERGPRLFSIMFDGHVVKRFTAHLDPSHLQPWNYYFTELWAELGQAGSRILIVVAGTLFVTRTVLRRWTDGAVIVLWFAIPLAAISMGTSKLIHYMYPFLAPVALSGGWLIAVIAHRVYAWIARPGDAIVERRDSLLPGVLRTKGVQMGLTVFGFAAVLAAIATATFDRLQIKIGTTVLRSSSELRPAVASGLAWLLGAPAQVLRAIAVAVALAVVLPIGSYQQAVAHAKQPNRRLQDLRACLTPIVAERVAQGRRAPGVLVDVRSISHVPFYYLRSFGPWQQQGASDEAVVRSLAAPTEAQPVILSTERYGEVMTRLVTDRDALIRRAAAEGGLDPARLAATLEQHSVGLVVLAREAVVLPGPYATCGSERVRLGSRPTGPS